MNHKSRRLEILHEDQWIVVVNKPAGLLSVGFPGFHGKTAQDILAERYLNKGKRRITAVHRLDRDTSGVMMFACSSEAGERIMNEWQEMVSERTYRCVCARIRGTAPLPDRTIIDLPIVYNKQNVGFVPKGNEKLPGKEGERAVTRMRVIERGGTFDLVECDLETGRKNQIRIHLSHLGHPIIGDEVYGKAFADEGTGIGRLALHARVLAFKHPFTDNLMRFESPEPAEFLAAVRSKRTISAQKTLTVAGSEQDPTVIKTRVDGKPRVGGNADSRRKPISNRKAISHYTAEAKADAGHEIGPGKRKKGPPEAGLEPKPRRRQRFANGSKFIPGN